MLDELAVTRGRREWKSRGMVGVIRLQRGFQAPGRSLRSRFVVLFSGCQLRHLLAARPVPHRPCPLNSTILLFSGLVGHNLQTVNIRRRNVVDRLMPDAVRRGQCTVGKA